MERGPGEVGKRVKRDVQGDLLGTKHSKDRASPPPQMCGTHGRPHPGWLAPGGCHLPWEGQGTARGPPSGFHGAVSIFICVPFCRGGESDEAGKRA